MHGPTCIFWANLTPLSLKLAVLVICAVGVLRGAALYVNVRALQGV